MDTPELAALIPGFMAQHVGHEWFLVSPEGARGDIVLTLFPAITPDRIATVRVNAGAEAFFIGFYGHSGVEFGYDDESRAATLQERIDLAVAATLGPTRVTLDFDGDVIVGSTLVINPDGPDPQQNGPASWPIQRLKARLRGRRISRQVVELPAASDDT